MRTVRVSPPVKLLALLIVLTTSLFLPSASKAFTCCGYAHSVTYYADAALTIPCGSCSSDCSLDGYTCTGDTSCPYTRTHQICCSCSGY